MYSISQVEEEKIDAAIQNVDKFGHRHAARLIHTYDRKYHTNSGIGERPLDTSLDTPEHRLQRNLFDDIENNALTALRWVFGCSDQIPQGEELVKHLAEARMKYLRRYKTNTELGNSVPEKSNLGQRAFLSVIFLDWLVKELGGEPLKRAVLDKVREMMPAGGQVSRN